MHYAWNVGNLDYYESTFYFHKIETMRMVKQWVQAPTAELAMRCARQITTLFLAEVRLDAHSVWIANDLIAVCYRQPCFGRGAYRGPYGFH